MGLVWRYDEQLDFDNFLVDNLMNIYKSLLVLKNVQWSTQTLRMVEQLDNGQKQLNFPFAFYETMKQSCLNTSFIEVKIY